MRTHDNLVANFSVILYMFPYTDFNYGANDDNRNTLLHAFNYC